MNFFSGAQAEGFAILLITCRHNILGMVVGEDLDSYRRLLGVKPDASLEELKSAYDSLQNNLEKKLKIATSREVRQNIEKIISQARIAYFYLIRAVMHPDYKDKKQKSHWDVDPTHKVRRMIARRIEDIATKQPLALPPWKGPRILLLKS